MAAGVSLVQPGATVGDAAATGDALDLTLCDREPIHIPGAIQPHGLLLIADATTRLVIGGAGDIDGRLTPAWQGRPLDALLAQDVGAILFGGAGETTIPIATVPGRTEAFDAILHVTPSYLLVELETAPATINTAATVLARLDRAGALFERASDLRSLCERAADVFRALTGFDRVMIYRFLDDGAGVVIAEDRDPTLHGFLNHHFPAGDIPKQARALYIRNRVRVIPDITYVPAPIVPAELRDIDLADVGLRSVSPIHLQYMANMGVRASASISIVKDGLLWGLIACHHNSRHELSYEIRAACATLADSLARQIRAKEEAETYRERIRLRAAEDQITTRLDADMPFEQIMTDIADDIRQMIVADGFATVQGREITSTGVVPDDADLLDLARWLAPRAVAEPFATRSLIQHYPLARAFPERASGVVATMLSTETSTLLIWFRAEECEVLNWAGNPHKDDDADPQAILTPRASFDDWVEEVRGRSQPWTLGQIDSASRLRRKLFDARQSRRLRELNRELGAMVADKEALIQQKDHLLREVNHRVQNSLQLVQAFLGLQARGAGEELASHLGEAQRRLLAVALVHRRLYQADQVETVDLARYLEELIAETRESMGHDWAAQMTLDLTPMLISADRAVNIGLILTELMINANKYAYGGAPGPISISLEEYRNRFRLIIADRGKGKSGPREGFGTRMMAAMVERLDGEIEYFDNRPGLRVIVTAPIDVERPAIR